MLQLRVPVTAAMHVFVAGSETLKGLRDRAMLALLLGCGLRWSELLALEVNGIEQREGRWVVPDLVGKGNRR